MVPEEYHLLALAITHQDASISRINWTYATDFMFLLLNALKMLNVVFM